MCTAWSSWVGEWVCAGMETRGEGGVVELCGGNMVDMGGGYIVGEWGSVDVLVFSGGSGVVLCTFDEGVICGGMIWIGLV